MIKNSLTPTLMFNDRGAEATEFYASRLPGAKIAGSFPDAEGNLLFATIEFNGSRFSIICGGPPCAFSEAATIMISCRDQAEVDTIYAALSEGGEELPCGWTRDQFGVFWQVIPSRHMELMEIGSPAQCAAVMNAMFTMTKFDIAAIEAAFESAE